MRFVAVTSCPTGIAHTYMAAEALEQAAADAGDVIHVETQGSAGSDPLDESIINAADAVIFAADVDVRGKERFAGKPLVQSGVKRAIGGAPQMLDEARAAAAAVPPAAGAGAAPAAASGGGGMPKSHGRDRDWFFVGLATLSFIADLYTVYQMVAKEIVFDFWTWQWVIAIILAALLAVGGFTFLGISGSKDSAAALLFIFGALYTIGSLIVYLYWAFRAIGGPIIVGDFLGFLTLFTILAGAGIFGVAFDKEKTALRFPSYGCAAASLAYVVLLVNEYVGKGASFVLWSFAGQVVILLIGIILFIGLYAVSAEPESTKTIRQ